MADIWLNVDSAVVVPLNILPFTDDTDFKSIETVVSSSSLWVCWNFIPVTGSPTQVSFVPASIYNRGNGIFTYTIPASAGTINNDSEGFGWFTGSGVGLLPFRSPMYGFRASSLNNNLIVNAHPLATGSGLATIPTTNYTDLISTRMSGSYIGSLASASRVEAIQTTVNSIPTTNYTNLISTRMSGSYLNSIASASSIVAIPTTNYTNLISTRMSGSYIGSLASASRVEAIQTTVNSIPTTNYTDLISTRMSGSYLNSIASASTVVAIPTTDYTSLISTRMSGSYLSTLGSASRVEAIQTTVSAIPTTNYTDLISTRMSGSYVGSLASASTVDGIYSNMISASSLVTVEQVWASENRTLTSGSIILEAIVDGTLTIEDVLKILLAVLSGSSSGGGTTEIKFKDPSGSVDVVTATVDANGNRTSVTLNTD